MPEVLIFTVGAIAGGAGMWAWGRLVQRELWESLLATERARGRLAAEIVMLEQENASLEKLLDDATAKSTPIPAPAPKKPVGKRKAGAKG